MYWKPNQTTAKLPERIRNFFSNEARTLIDDLQSNNLEVILIPTPDPKHSTHKIRQVVNKNPGWYCELFQKHYPNFRRDRSIKALVRITKNQDPPFIHTQKEAVPYKYHYDTLYRYLIFERLTEGYFYGSYFIQPEQE